jgi:PIN domain nuclease of toxin-antitoxin system
MIFLDTHVLVWLYEGLLNKFSQKAKLALEENELLISPMVELELTFLHEIGRLNVSGPDIIRYLDSHIGLSISRLDFYRIVEEANALTWTRDPFDRLIVAQAQALQVPLLSKDSMLNKHCDLVFWK